MKRLLFFLVFGVCFSLNSFAFAQVRLNKYRLNLDIKPGQVINEAISVDNISTKTIKVKAYFEDFEYLPPFDGNKKSFPLGSRPDSCGQWINISPSEFVLPPLGKQKVICSIEPPQDAKGGYYGVLFFEKIAEESSGIGVSIRMGCSFLLEAQDKEKTINIDNVLVSNDNIKGNFLNSGNVILISEPFFYIMNKKNVVLDKGVVKKFYLPPGEKAPFAVTVAKKIPQGEYTLVINLDLEGGGVLVKEIDFLKDASGNLEIIKVKD